MVMAIMPRHYWFIAVACSLALISDVLDGWCYRNFTKHQPYKHWFNRLPITLDPLADFCFVSGGVIHVMDNKIVGIIVSIAVAIGLVLWLQIGFHAPDRVYTFMMTGLTYVWFALMIIALVAVWYTCVPITWFAGVIVTMIIFYAIWFKTRIKDRSIRRRG